MTIAGIQAISLIDYPGVISTIVFTQGCVFRCPYCHNPELIPLAGATTGPSQEDLFALLRRHRNMIEGVCITGGEPTIHHDLLDLIREIKRERLLVKLDTNGIHPGMIRRAIDEHLVDYIAMDLKHRWEKYEHVTRTKTPRVIENCMRTFEMIQRSSIPHEFRTTIYGGLHTPEDIIQIAMQLQPGERYALQPIRYGKMLDPLPNVPPMDLDRIVNDIRNKRPDLDLVVRG